jgi:hypothetical protein
MENTGIRSTSYQMSLLAELDKKLKKNKDYTGKSARVEVRQHGGKQEIFAYQLLVLDEDIPALLEILKNFQLKAIEKLMVENEKELEFVTGFLPKIKELETKIKTDRRRLKRITKK